MPIVNQTRKYTHYGLLAVLLISILPALNVFNGKFISSIYYLQLTVLFGLVIFFITLSKEDNITISKLEILLTIFLGFVIISPILQKNFDLNLSTPTLIILITFGFFLSQLADKKLISILNFVSYILVILVTFEALIGLMQYYGISNFIYSLPGSKFMHGSLAIPVLYYAFLSINIPVVLILYYKQKSDKQRTLIFSVLCLIILVLITTKSRTAWLATIVSAAVFLLLLKKDKVNVFFKNKKLLTYISILFTIILFFAILWLLYFIRPASAKGRLVIWQTSFRIIKENFFTGIGFGNFAARYMDFQEAFFRKPGNIEKYQMFADNVNHAHNEFIQIFAEIGLIGFLIFVGIFVWLFYSSISLLWQNRVNKDHQLYLIGSLSALTAFLFTSFFNFALYFPEIAVFYFLHIGIISAIIKANDPNLIIFQFHFRSIVKILLLSISIFLLIYASLFIRRDYIARSKWAQAVRITYLHDYSSAAKIYAELNEYLQYDGEFNFMYGAVSLKNKQYEKAVRLLEKSKKNYNNTQIYIALGQAYEGLDENEKALHNYEKVTFMTPQKLFPHYLIVKLYQKIGLKDEALKKAKYILAMPVKIPSAAVFEIKAEMQKLLDPNGQSFQD